MPFPSYWPILLADSILPIAVGALTGVELVIIGGVLTIYCMFRFAL